MYLQGIVLLYVPLCPLLVSHNDEMAALFDIRPSNHHPGLSLDPARPLSFPISLSLLHCVFLSGPVRDYIHRHNKPTLGALQQPLVDTLVSVGT